MEELSLGPKLSLQLVWSDRMWNTVLSHYGPIMGPYVEGAFEYERAHWFKALKDAGQQIERFYRLTAILPAVGDSLQTLDEELSYKSLRLYIEKRKLFSVNGVDAITITYEMCAEHIISSTSEQLANLPALEH
ncbi:MAG: hypothetical protein ACRYF0_03885 [Janthinobacterium lividum]